jgi:hypothetical protein
MVEEVRTSESLVNFYQTTRKTVIFVTLILFKYGKNIDHNDKNFIIVIIMIRERRKDEKVEGTGRCFHERYFKHVENMLHHEV